MLATSLDPNSSELDIRKTIINYKTIEEKMWESTTKLSNAFEMANFVNPDLNNNLEAPTNVYAVKIKRDLEEELNKELIREFAKKYDFVLFAESYCKYCVAFEPVFKDFAADFNFKYEITSLKSEAGKIAMKLGVSSVPTLIAVKKDGKFAFEVSRGMLSRSGLEETIILAKKYSDEKASK
jgi:thioredoxin-like negative regulator of GroEL